MRFPVPPHPSQHLLLAIFFIIAVLTSMKWYLIVALICISLMMNDVEYLFMCILATYMFFGEMSIQIVCPFNKLNYLSVLLVSCKSSLIILDTRLLPDVWFVSIFSHSMGCLFTFLIVSFEAQTFLVLLKIYLFIFIFIFGCIGSSFLCEGFL